MRAGDLRRRITIQVRGTATDTAGQQSTTWTDLFTVWADIEGLSGRELFAAQAVQSEITHTIRVRYRPEFAAPRAITSLRAIYGGRIFNISGSINVDERNQEVWMQAAEGLNNG